ncbi:DUF982 domain-containing protein [Ensifer sp. LC163]|uniref:DUF982 domain-containing protein n=1 Tax=Ensifer sp. LC163 TaxID=1120652 RepID=UPI000ADBF455
MQGINRDHPVSSAPMGSGVSTGHRTRFSISEWPQGGWFYERARNRCHAALERGENLGLSRKAFIGAAIECSFPIAEDDIAS